MTETVQVSEETRSWARQVLDRFRAVEALHTPMPLWQIPGAEDQGSWEHPNEALEFWAEYESYAREEHTVEELSTFAVCAECARVERELAQAHEMEDWGHLESIYPCETAKALGHTEIPE